MTESQRQDVEKELVSFEKYRKRLHRAQRTLKILTRPLRVGYVIGVIMLVAASFLPFLMPIVLPFIGIAAGLFILEIILQRLVFRNPEDRFYTRFQKEVKPRMFQNLFPGASFEPDGYIPLKVVQNSLLFGYKIERCEGEDKVEGEVEGIKYQFSELHLRQSKSFLRSLGEGLVELPFEILFSFIEPEGDIGADSGPDLITVFKGGCAQIVYPEKFKGSAIIQARENKWMKVFARTYRKGRSEQSTGDSAFDKAFNIYASSELSLAELLPAQVRKQLLALQTKHQSRIAISLYSGYMFIALPWGKDWFGVELEKPVPSLEEYEDFIDDLEQIQALARSFSA